LDGSNFIKLHRSCLVRIDFIDRLIHEGRRWTARLKDGTKVSIAQNSVQRVLAAARGESSKPQPGSSTPEPLTLTIG
jgi:DNA-binding LytR/AlgR family response regulator